MEQAGAIDPDSLTWKMHKELTVHAGAVRALLMLAADPLMAALARGGGTAGDGARRLIRLASLRALLPFATRREAERAAGEFDRLRTSRGTDPVTGRALDGAASDQLLWMHASLEQSTVLFYELTVRPLTGWQKERYHRESLAFAEIVGLPAGRVPPSYPATEAHIREVVASDRLLVTDVARTVAGTIDAEATPSFPSLIRRLVLPAAVGTLPPEIRELYGFRWTPGGDRGLAAALWFTKRVRPVLPRRIRWTDTARIADRRRKGENLPPPGLEPGGESPSPPS